MDGPETDPSARGQLLLFQLDHIFVADPLIDELGFVHPSELTSLHSVDDGATSDSPSSKIETSNPLGSASSPAGEDEYHTRADCSRKIELQVDKLDVQGSRYKEGGGDNGLPYDSTVFWCGDHKLAISMVALAPIYKSAKGAFLSTRSNYLKLLQAEQNIMRAEHQEPVGSPGIGQGNKEDRKRKIAAEKVKLEDSLMSYTRALVLINCDHASAWNSRKQILLSRVANQQVLTAELQMAAVVLSCGPKSEEAWAYRRWVINQMINGGLSRSELDSLLEGESKLVEAVAGEVLLLCRCFCASDADSGLTAGFLIGVSQRSLMNYRAWRHRCWLVSQMSFLQVAIELHRTKLWASFHVSDNCCFHYRRCLLLQLIKSKVPKSAEVGLCTATALEKELDIKSLRVALLDGPETRVLWKEEMDWVKNLLQRYVGREALWIHLRFLFFSWICHIGPILLCPYSASLSAVCKRASSNAKETLLSIGSEQHFVDCCLSACSSDLTDEGDRQREFAATYKLWVLMMGSRQEKILKTGIGTTDRKEFHSLEQLMKNADNGSGTTDEDFQSLEQLLLTAVPHRSQLWEGLLSNLRNT